MKKNNLFFDPKSSFIELPIVWSTIAALALIAGILAITIYVHGNYYWDFSATGFNYFIGDFRVPIGIVALTIPVLALLATNHRSVQTRAQILESTKQNNFSNYYKHQEEFCKYIQEFENLSGLIPNYRKTHAKIFPNAIAGDISIEDKIISEIDSISKVLVELIDQFNTCHKKTQIDSILDINTTCDKLADTFHVKNTQFKNLNILLHKGKQGSLRDLELRQIFIKVKAISRHVNTIMSFDTNFTPSKNFQKLINLNHQNVPHHKINENENTIPFNVFEELQDNALN